MLKILIVGAGGFLGAVARYLISGAVQERVDSPFPAGTLVVNALGCLLLGALMALVEYRSVLGPETRLFLTIGLLGAFTTFSTFGFETLELMRSGSAHLAALSVLGNLGIGLAGVWAGLVVGRVIAG